MPDPYKGACPGQFSEEIQELLMRDTDRARWRDYPCQLCGQIVSARGLDGRWQPERHWASVEYSQLKNRMRSRQKRKAE